jgi:hypothetical protein
VTGLGGFTVGNLVMDLVGISFIYLAIKKHYEPLLLIPIGFGILLGNVPPIRIAGEYVFYTSVTNPNSQMYFLYYGVLKGIYPPLIFLGIGALTDFSYLISNPRLILLGAAAQFGIFVTYFGALHLGFSPTQAGSIGIIGGADGPTAIFLSSMLAPELIAPIAIAAYSYMALVPVIQPPIMKLLTTREERLIRMKPPREVSRVERVIFPVITFHLCGLHASCTRLFDTPGNADVRQSLAGIGSDGAARANRTHELRRHRHHSHWHLRGLQCQRRDLPDGEIAEDICARRFQLHDRNGIGGAVRQAHELAESGTAQPAHRSCGSERGAGLGARGPDGGQ